MCGRFTLTKDKNEIAERFEIHIDPAMFSKTYNAAPSQTLPIITNTAPEQASFHKWGLIPHWAKDGGPERLMAALKDKNERSRMKNEIAPSRLQNNWLTNFTKEHNKGYEGRLITDIAESRGQDPADALFDLLLDENLSISTVGLGTNPQTLPAFVAHPYGMIASDAILYGEYPNPRTYGCFPIVLSEFVRAEQHKFNSFSDSQI